MVRILIRNLGPEAEQAGKREQGIRLSKAGRELLALGASRYYGITWESEKDREIRLETGRNRWGKPYLVRYPELHFNISHSGTFAACAFGDEPVGLDIQICSDADFLKLADRFFCHEDRELVRNAANIRQMFYRVWTKEESYAKWKGNGLAENIGKTERQGVCSWFEPAEGIQGALWTGRQEKLQISYV